MGYEGVDGLYTVFPEPTVRRAVKGAIRSTRKAKSRRTSRAFGTRKRSSRARKPRAASISSLRTSFKAGSAPRKEAPVSKAERKATRSLEKSVEALAIGGMKNLPQAKSAWAQAVAKVRGVPLKSAAGILWPVAAGFAAYAMTTYFLRRSAEKKRTREEQAALLAQAYRQLRLDAADALGRPLNKTELSSLAAAFKDQVAAHGLTEFFWKGK